MIQQTEIKHAVSLENSFKIAITAHGGGRILDGKFVYVVPSVFKSNGPSRDDVSALLKASGAVQIDSSNKVRKTMEKKGYMTKLIIITVDGDVLEAHDNGPFKITWPRFVSAMLKQDFEQFKGIMGTSPPLSLISGKDVIDITTK